MGLVDDKVTEFSTRMDEVIEAWDRGGRQAVADLVGLRYNTTGHFLKQSGLYQRLEDHKKALEDRERVRNPFDGSDFGDYLLGYALGDGSLGVKDGQVVCLDISSSDREHLVKIQSLWDKRVRLLDPYKGNSRLVTYDRNIARSCLEFGLVPAKSYVGCRVARMNYAVLRGLLDSDGCVRFGNKGRTLLVEWFGHPSYMEQVYEFLKPYSPTLQKRETLWAVCLYKQEELKRLRIELYKGSTCYLQRKYERFHELF